MFGKSKKKQAAQQPQPMQMSPETMALLQAMQAGQQMQQQMQQQQMMMQQMGQQPAPMAPQMPQGQMMPNQMPGQMPGQMMPGQMIQGQMPAQMAPAMPQTQMPPQMEQGQMGAVMDDQALLAELGGVPQPQMPQEQMQQPQMPQAQMPDPLAPQMAMGAAAQQPAPSATPDSFVFGQQTAFAQDADAAAPAKKKGKMTREEKRALAAQKKEEKNRKQAEKKALATEKAEEKKRAKRRKKLAKTRFSRARYLREANGNAIAGVVLWIFIIIIFIVGPFMLNTALLIPQTNENLRIVNELDSYKRSIISSRPQITAMVEKRKAKKGQITAFTSSFTPSEQAAKSLENLNEQLEEAGLEVSPITVAPFPLAAQSIIGTSAKLEIQGNYLDWLRLRNKFVRSHRAISIPSESVEVNEETGQMSITAQIILPSSR